MRQPIASLVKELKERDLILPIWGAGGRVILLDQTRLPFETV